MRKFLLTVLLSEIALTGRAGCTIDLTVEINAELPQLYLGVPATGLTWNWNEGSTTTWNAQLDLSGIALSQFYQLGSETLGDLALVTQKHCVAAGHIFDGSLQPGGGPPSQIGKRMVFCGVDGRFYTNSVAAEVRLAPAGVDTILITLASNVPPTVHPFWLFPTNIGSYFTAPPLYALTNCQCVWFRNNSQKMNVCVSYSSVDAPYRPNSALCPFQEPLGTGGDSGAPVFFVVNGKSVLSFLVYNGDPGGEFLGIPGTFAQLQAQIPAQYPLQLLDLSAYTKYQ